VVRFLFLVETSSLKAGMADTIGGRVQRLKVNGIAIQALRTQKAWSQEQLAEIACISVRTVQRVENGGPASFGTLRGLASAFDIDVGNLLVQDTTGRPEGRRGDFAPTFLGQSIGGLDSMQRVPMAMEEQEPQLILHLIERTEQQQIEWEWDDDLCRFVATVGDDCHIRIWAHVEEKKGGWPSERGLDQWELAGYAVEITSEGGASNKNLWERGDRTLLSRLFDAAETSVRDRQRQRVVELIAKTERGEIRWECEGDTGCLIAAAGVTSHLRIEPWYKEGYKEGYDCDLMVGGHQLHIRDERDQLLTKISDEGGEGAVEHLYDAARTSIDRRTIHTVLDHLKVRH
jgi:transcriptional regulator with XRE-family HTH domain